MGRKKGDARKLVLKDAIEDEDSLTATGPDDDGDVLITIDIPNQEEASITLNPKAQKKLLGFLQHALADTGADSDDE